MEVFISLKERFKIYKQARSELEGRDVPMGEGICLVRDVFIADSMEEAKELTKKNTGLKFTVAFNYGGRAEIVDAVKQMLTHDPDYSKITEKRISKFLYNDEMPAPDLIIRTSGEQRISNFLLWQSAYSEFLFLEELWPDFSRQSLHKAIREYQNRTRRFGDL